jgi:hypothetical protein
MRRPSAITVGLAAIALLGCGGTPGSEPVIPVASGSPPAASTPAASASPASAEPTARQADLAYLVDQLRATHPNPFLDEGEAGFLARVDELAARVDALSDAGFMVAVMELMGDRERDGHSGAWAMAQTGERLHAWPVWLWDFPDGLRVVAADADDQDLIGARLVQVGDRAVDDARVAVEPLVPRDNVSSLRANLPMYLTLPEVLDALRMREPGGPGLTFELTDGSTRELTSDPLPIPAFHAWILGVYGTDYPTGLPPDDTGPAHLRRRSEAFWSEVSTDPPGLYAAYNRVLAADASGYRVGQLAGEIRAAARGDPDQPFAIDLRNNPGGDNNTFGDLRRAVETMARERPGRVSVITGRSTFSAAGNFVTELMVGPEGRKIRLVGEAPGGGLNIYGDVRVVTLPTSQIVVLISRRYHERAPGDDRLALPPDAPVELTWDDYAAGRDPVLEAAFGE